MRYVYFHLIQFNISSILLKTFSIFAFMDIIILAFLKSTTAITSPCFVLYKKVFRIATRNKNNEFNRRCKYYLYHPN